MKLTSPNPQRKPPIRFGSDGIKLAQMTAGVDKVFHKIGASRGREMIVEDLMGFGFLRTGMDLLRGYFYGNGTLNIPAAGERLFRESTSIFTDNVLSGLAAKGLGYFFDKNGRAFSNGFTDFPTVEMFQEVLKKHPVDNGKEFIEHLSERLVKDHPPKADTTAFKKALQEIWETGWEKEKLAKGQLVEQATDLAKKLGQDHFDLKVGQNTFKLDNLLDDLRIFKSHMQAKEKKGLQTAAKGASRWASTALKSIDNTVQAKNWKLGCVLLGMVSTFAMPFLNVALTKQAYGIDYYPGEMGLRQKQAGTGQAGQPPQGFMEKHFPYIAENLRKGKFLPLLLALAPLPFAVGLFDVAAMKVVNPLQKNAWAALKQGKLGGVFNKHLRNMFDFCKEAPFTAQQQMASIFALLITSRLLCARSDNEFRERMVDSFAGWGLWILGTPLMKKAVASYLDANKGTMLQKTLQDGSKALRSRAEIDALLKKGLKVGGKEVTPQIIKATKSAHIWLGAGSTIASMVLLGIVEPLVGIQWTKFNERKKQEAAAKQNAANMPRLQPSFSSATPLNLPNQVSNPARLPGPFSQPMVAPFSSVPILSQAALNPQRNRFIS